MDNWLNIFENLSKAYLTTFVLLDHFREVAKNEM